MFSQIEDEDQRKICSSVNTVDVRRTAMAKPLNSNFVLVKLSNRAREVCCRLKLFTSCR